MVSFEGMQPFVVSIEVVCGRMDGIYVFGVPIGVELATSSRRAFSQAIQRWPYRRNLLKPEPWENVSPEDRMMALEADRQIC